MADRDFVVTGTEVTPTGHRVLVSVPADLRYFDGHFDGHPMLPGVAQVVALADRHARRLYAGLGGSLRLQRVKFTAVIGPGEPLALGLAVETKDAEVRVRWTLERLAPPSGDAAASSGTLVYTRA